MGYFSNGTEGEWYESRYCDKCHHGMNGDCPVFMAHLIHNYDECNKPESILHMLIPRDEKGYNEECKMFIPRLGKASEAV